VALTNNADDYVIADAVPLELVDAVPNRAIWAPTVPDPGD
jgi:hypothetical protein